MSIKKRVRFSVLTPVWVFTFCSFFASSLFFLFSSSSLVAFSHFSTSFPRSLKDSFYFITNLIFVKYLQKKESKYLLFLFGYWRDPDSNGFVRVPFNTTGSVDFYSLFGKLFHEFLYRTLCQ